MKRLFSTQWKGSSQVRKQRKYRYHAPFHLKTNFLNAPLSKELRTKHKRRSLTLRAGDEVEVMRGTFSKKKAKVTNVDRTRTRVTLEGIQRSKRDGSKVAIYFRAHALKIITIGGDDKRRLEDVRSDRKEKQHAPNQS